MMNGTELEYNSNYTDGKYRVVSTLILEDIQPQDFGIYKCFVSDGVCLISSETNLSPMGKFYKIDVTKTENKIDIAL